MFKTGVFAFLALCGTSLLQAQAPQETTASAAVKDAQGRPVGTATLRETPHGVLIKVELQGLPAGPHAIHIHTTGTCEAPMFTSAGGHFAPQANRHGVLVANGPHAGDLPNLYAAADGKVTAEMLASSVTLSAGPRSLFDADGAALVVHATADDYRTDPAGNAGDRIACGVIAK